MLVDIRRQIIPRLSASHEAVDVRLPGLRVAAFRSSNVSADFGLLERATPFIHHLSRPQITLILEGRGRFEEGERRAWVDEPSLVVSDVGLAGTEAYAGARCRYLILTWDPSIFGAPFSGTFSIDAVAPRDRLRIAEATSLLGTARTAEGISTIVRVLRGIGFAFLPLEADDLDALDPEPDFARLQCVMSATLMRLDRHPSIDDLCAQLGWNHRRVHRRLSAMAEAYGHAFTHWREALHQARLLHALRLLSAPGATTELVAKLSGFRAPTALCHAFEASGLPSPGVLARAARRDALEEWSAFVR